MTGNRTQISIDSISVSVSDSDRLDEITNRIVETLTRLEQKLDAILKKDTTDATENSHHKAA